MTWNSADGTFAPPLEFYKYYRLPEESRSNFILNWGIGSNENGWMTAESFGENVSYMITTLRMHAVMFIGNTRVDKNRMEGWYSYVLPTRIGGWRSGGLYSRKREGRELWWKYDIILYVILVVKKKKKKNFRNSNPQRRPPSWLPLWVHTDSPLWFDLPFGLRGLLLEGSDKGETKENNIFDTTGRAFYFEVAADVRVNIVCCVLIRYCV